AKLRAEWQRDGRIDNVTYSLRQDKVLKFLVDNAKVTEVEKLTQQGTPLPEAPAAAHRSEEHTSELQSQSNLVCRLLLEKKILRTTQYMSQIKITMSKNANTTKKKATTRAARPHRR